MSEKVEVKCPRCEHVNSFEVKTFRGHKDYSEFCLNCKAYIGFTVKQVTVSDEVWDYDEMEKDK